jgi:hypothetical protein
MGCWKNTSLEKNQQETDNYIFQGSVMSPNGRYEFGDSLT